MTGRALPQVAVTAEQGWAEPVVGVIGGNGPLATAIFQRAVVERTAVATDQEHVDMVVLNHSSTPDRTAAILDPAAADPGRVMALDAVRLERLGCAVLVLPCNTAHHFIEKVHEASSLPVLSIVAETAKAAVRRARELAEDPAGPVSVGVLATDGTVHAKVYQEELDALGARTVLPSAREQQVLMSIIYDGVKGGGEVDMSAFERIIGHVLSRGASVVVLGCTELSVLYAEHAHLAARPYLVDSLETLAVRTVESAGRPVRAR